MQKTFLSKPQELFTDEVNTFINKDILHKVAPHLNGMSWQEPWTYMGGCGLAGFHFEDGMLHFGHHLIDCTFSFFDDTDPNDKQMLKVWSRFSRKTWVVSKHSGTKGVLECNKFLADDLCVSNLGDSMLMARLFVLDPRDFKDSDNFTVIYQNPGDFMFGDLGHCVSGFGLLSFAWNFALDDSISTYIKLERNMAAITRKCSLEYREQRALFAGGLEPDIRSFTFMNSMLDYIITTDGDNIIPLVLDKMKFCYTFEKEMCFDLNAEFIADDEEYAPVVPNDAQCTHCGISCLFAMYVVQHKKRHKTLEAICWQCAQPYKGKQVSLKVVSILPTFMARKFQLV
jgi:hypothetical protein